VDGYIDGGIVANNPSMAALAQALHPGGGGRRLEEVALLSVGSGQSAHYIPGDHHDWGYLQWARPIVQIAFDAQMDMVHFQCRQLLGERYHRVAQLFEWHMPLDDWSKVDDLRTLAEAVDLAPTVAWVRAMARGRRATA
jgi:hypothetical protein